MLTINNILNFSRYGLFDYDYKYSPDGAESINRSKIFLMSWCPDTSKIKKKMLYSARYLSLVTYTFKRMNVLYIFQ